jgi:hypothetical protein
LGGDAPPAGGAPRRRRAADAAAEVDAARERARRVSRHGGPVPKDVTVPALKKFVELGGTWSPSAAAPTTPDRLRLPVKSYLTEMGPDGHERNLPADKFYIPGSLLKMNVDNTNPAGVRHAQAGRRVLR